MYDSPSGTVHECENCGAQLPAPDEHGNRTCSFCHSVFSPPAPVAPATPPQMNLVINAPGYSAPMFSATPGVVPDFDPVNPPKKGRGCGCFTSLLVLAIILAAVGVPLYFGLHSAGVNFGNFNITSPFEQGYTYGAPMMVLPGEPSAPPSFITTGSQYASGGTQYKVLRYNGKDSKPVWASPSIGDGTIDQTMANDGKNVYVTAKAKVYAFKLSDGTQAWQAALSDDVSSYGCDSCLIVMGDHVIVRSTDETLQAYDAATGAPAWSHRLASASAKVVHTAKSLIVVDGDSGKEVPNIVDPATGTAGASIDATCSKTSDASYVEHAGSSAVYRPTPDGASLLIIFGSSPGCIQSWNPVTGAAEWSVVIDGSTSFDNSTMSLLDTPSGLVVSDSRTIGIIGPEHTEYRVLGQDKDLNYYALGYSGTDLIAEVKSTRGTTKTSIMAIDIPTGAEKWTVAFGKSVPVDAPTSSSSYNASSDGSYTAQVVDAKVYVLTMTEGRSYDHKLSVDSIDIATGTPGARVTMDANSHDLIPAFGPPQWSGTKVVTRVGDDTIQIIDTATAQRVLRIP